MNRIPFKHQKEGAAYIQRNGGGFLFMEQRTGKTLTAILGHQGYVGIRKILIVTKKTIMDVWSQELAMEGIHPNDITVIRGTKSQRQSLLEDVPRYGICNYEMLIPYRVIDSHHWDVVIFDESSAISNGEAKVTRYVLRSIARLKAVDDIMVMCLSGNPAPETALQYASQFLLVKGEYFECRTLPDYIWRYWRKEDSTGKMVPKSPVHLSEIKKMVRNHCFVRTMDQLKMGSKILYGRRYVEMNVQQHIALRWAIAKKEALNSGGREIGDKVYVGYLNQIAAGIHPGTGEMINTAKITDILEYYKENPEPMVVLSFFKKPLYTGAALAFDKGGMNVDVITGDTRVQDRDRIIKQFQSGKLDILFGQSDALKMGIDLSRACITFFISNSFSNDTRDQAVMRTTNVNKKEPVQIIDVCTAGSLDDRVVDKLIQKEEISDSFLVSEFKELVGNYAEKK